MYMCSLRRFRPYGNGTTSAALLMTCPGQPLPTSVSILPSIGAYSGLPASMSRNGLLSTLVGNSIGLVGCSSSDVSSLPDGCSTATVASAMYPQRYRAQEPRRSPCTFQSLVGHSL